MEQKKGITLLQSLERRDSMGGILWGIISILFVLWLIGFMVHIGGALIHLLLVVAVGLFVVNLLTGRKAPAS
jgi:hypothetical protein